MPQFLDDSEAWIAVPSAPPLRVTIVECIDEPCEGCDLPRYHCLTEAGQHLSICASMLRLQN